MVGTAELTVEKDRRPVVGGSSAVFVAAGGACGLIAGLFGVGSQVTLVIGPVVGMLGGLVARADLRTRRIPDRLLLAGVISAVVIAATIEIVDGRRPAVTMLLGAVVAAVPLLAVHVAMPEGVGFGDVKFAAVTGALLGAIAPGLAGVAVAVACLLAIFGAAARLWPRYSIPFGACLAVAALASLTAGRFIS